MAFQGIRDAAQQVAASHQRHLKLIARVALVGAPILATLFGAVGAELWKAQPWLTFAFAVVLGGVWFFCAVVTDTNLHAIFPLFLEHEETLKELQGEREKLREERLARTNDQDRHNEVMQASEAANKFESQLLLVYGLWMLVALESRKRAPLSVQGLRDSCELMLYMFREQPAKFLGAEPDELWNIAVYIHDHRANLLRPVWRATSPNHPARGREGRHWCPGEGHVGAAFQASREKVVSDATAPAVARLLDPPSAKAMEHDKRCYVSVAAYPISLDYKSGSKVFGVLVATSNIAERFNDENPYCRLVFWASKALASLFDVTDFDSGTVFQAVEGNPPQPHIGGEDAR